MAQNQIKNASEALLRAQDENEIFLARVIKTFYMHHRDGLNRLSPVLLMDGERVWHVGIKKKFNGVKMYYIFLNSTYIKLWKDSKSHLLFFIDNYSGDLLFFSEEPQIWQIDFPLPRIEDYSLTYNDVTLKFSMPIFSIVRKLNQWVDVPIASIIMKLFSNWSPEGNL